VNDEYRKYRKYWILALFGLIIAFLAYAVADEALNQQVAFEVIVNNTDLCNFNHTSLACNGTRQANTTYYANDSAIQIFIIAHADTAGQNATIMLYINDVIVEHISGKPLAAAGDNWKTAAAIIPKGASYKAVFLNYHHFEWREYQILSGKNGTLSINNTNTTITNTFAGGNWTIDTNFTNRFPTSRTFGTVYWNNQSKPMILDFAFINSTSTMNLNYILYINSTAVKVIADPAGKSGNIYYFIPNGASYRITNTSSGTATTTTWFEHNLTFTPSIVYNSYNTTTGSGVSDLANLTINTNKDWQGYNITNLSGLNMTGNITNATRIMGRSIIGYNMDSNNPPYIVSNDVKSGLGSDYVAQFQAESNAPAFQFFAYANDSIYEGATFNAVRVRGNISNQQSLLKDDLLFGINAKGKYQNGGVEFVNLTTSRIAILMTTDEAWSSTSQGTRIDIYTTKNGTTSAAKAITIWGDKNITVYGLAGTGTAYTCVDATGNLFRGSPGC